MSFMSSSFLPQQRPVGLTRFASKFFFNRLLVTQPYWHCYRVYFIWSDFRSVDNLSMSVLFTHACAGISFSRWDITTEFEFVFCLTAYQKG